MNRWGKNCFMAFLFILPALLCVISCGEDSQGRQSPALTEAQQHGNIAVKLNWHNDDTGIRNLASRSIELNPDGTLNCTGSNVSTIYVAIFDQLNDDAMLIDNGDGWDCSDHYHLLSNVPTGNMRKVVVLGLDESGQALVRGEQQNVVVVASNSPADATAVNVNMDTFAAVQPVIDNPTPGAAAQEIQWQAVPDAAGYDIQLATDAAFSNVLIDDFVEGDRYAAVPFPVSGTYFCRIRPVDSVGLKGAWSEMTITVIVPPTVTTTGVAFTSATQVQLKGTINPNGLAATYFFEYGPTTAYGNSTPQQTLESGSAEVPVYADISGLVQNTTYHYRLMAANGEGESAYSDDRTFDTQMAPPEAPTQVNVSANSEQVVLNWSSVPNATGYTIYWATHSGVSKTRYNDNIENITATSYAHDNRTNCSWYYYVITAHNGWGESAASEEVQIMPPQVDFYVAPPPLGDEAHSGITTGAPAATIQQALDKVAACSGQHPVTIHVAEGQYTEKITLKTPAVLEGGWNGEFTQRENFEQWGLDDYKPDAFKTVIGGGSTNDAEPCVTADGDGIPISISGFGFVDCGAGASARAIHNLNAALVVDHCMLSESTESAVPSLRNDSNHPTQIRGSWFFSASPGAASIYLSEQSSTDILNCQIQFGGQNSVERHTPAIMNLSLVNTTISQSNFSFNKSSDHGGAIYNGPDSRADIMDCTFTMNSIMNADETSGNGGAIYNDRALWYITITNCLFIGNQAYSGGAIYNNQASPSIVNCVFNGNAAFSGGAIYNNSADADIINCTFIKNMSIASDEGFGGYGGAIYNNDSSPEIYNTILWENSANIDGHEIYNTGDSSPYVRYCIIDQDDYLVDYFNNISRDPLFDSDAAYGFHLTRFSPARNRANIGHPPEFDIDNEPRMQDDDKVDIGADEYVDTNQDGKPDYLDE